MLKNRTLFNPEIDRRNRNKSKPKEKIKKLETLTTNLHAPISKKERRKRIKQEASHNEKSLKAGSPLRNNYKKNNKKREKHKA